MNCAKRWPISRPPVNARSIHSSPPTGDLRPLYDAYVKSADPPQQKRTALLAAFLPGLRRKRKEEQGLAAITGAVGTDPSFASALLQDATLLHAAAEPTASALTDLTAVESQGLSMRLYLDNDLGGPAGLTLEAAATGIQMATVGGAIRIDDELITTINGVAIRYKVVAADSTLAILAASVAACINATTAPDPVAKRPLNELITACASASAIGIVGIDAAAAPISFTTSQGATTTYTAGGAVPIAGTWQGYVDAPQDGFYDIYVETDAGATVKLQIGDVDVTGSPAPGSNTWTNQSPISFKAGNLTPIRLTVTSIIGRLSVTWEAQGLGRSTIPAASLYSWTLVENLCATYVRFLKAASIASALSLSANEIAAPVIGQGWLNALDVSGTTPDATTAESLRDVLTALLDFARLKRALSPRDERLLAVLRDPSAVLPDGSLAVRSLTGWPLDSLNALMERFFGNIQIGNLSSIENFARVYDALNVVKASRLTAIALIAATTNAPTGAHVRALQSALRAHYAERDWIALVRPLNDAMRIQQRDALVAYILQQFADAYEQSLVRAVTVGKATGGTTTLMVKRLYEKPGGSTNGIASGMRVQGTNISVYTTVTRVSGDTVTINPGIVASLPDGSPLTFMPADALEINTADKLFEYFLIDVATQPAVETSRIRLALSSVQIFIERILRNLEPQCSPADVEDPNGPPQWPWRKRYRVWQANREVFLWPENWLYPELRDDQSPIFKETMSALLQSDITDDAAAGAYLEYLRKLGEIAKLEPCGLWYEEPKSSDESGISYVIARTAGVPRYYFRKLQSGTWTPWTEAKIDCEDMPVTPICWNGRLFLFWLKVMPQPNTSAAALPSVEDNDITPLGDMPVNALFGKSGPLHTAVSQGQSVDLAAVLCWSEFHNGKWGPTAMSHKDRPTCLGRFDAATWASDRDLWRIVPLKLEYLSQPVTPFNLPKDALMLAIKTDDPRPYGPWPGFILYNTHSIPLRGDDIRLTMPDGTSNALLSLVVPPYPGRELKPRFSYAGNINDRFHIEYQTDDFNRQSRDLLNFTRVPRYTEPQPGLADAWEAPFLFEDRSYCFYVTTNPPKATISAYTDFGTLSVRQGLRLSDQSIPPLAVQPSADLVTSNPSRTAKVRRALGTVARPVPSRPPR
jgi:hypothetical protein